MNKNSTKKKRRLVTCTHTLHCSVHSSEALLPCTPFSISQVRSTSTICNTDIPLPSLTPLSPFHFSSFPYPPLPSGPDRAQPPYTTWLFPGQEVNNFLTFHSYITFQIAYLTLWLACYLTTRLRHNLGHLESQERINWDAGDKHQIHIWKCSGKYSHSGQTKSAVLKLAQESNINERE